MRIHNAFLLSLLVILLTATPLPILAARLGGGFRARPSFSGGSGTAIGKPAYTAVGYPVNRPIRLPVSTYPTGYRRPYGGFFPGTVPLWIIAGSLYASGPNYALVDDRGAPLACDVPADSVDAYKIFNNFDSIVNGTGNGTASTPPVTTPGTVVDNTMVAPAVAPVPAPAPAPVPAPAVESSAGVVTAAQGPAVEGGAISEADRQAVLQAVETGQLNLDTINPALINQTYILEQCSASAAAAALKVSMVAVVVTVSSAFSVVLFLF